MARNYTGLSEGFSTQTLRTPGGQPVVLAEDVRAGGIGNYTTTERNAINALTLDNNMVIYNTTTDQFEIYTGGTRDSNTGQMSGGSWDAWEIGSAHDPSSVAHTIRQSETIPSINPGVPPATNGAEGTPVGGGSGAQNWYDPNGSNVPTNPVPRWNAEASVTRMPGSNRVLSFAMTGSGGTEVTANTDVAQIIDFDFAGTIGQRTLQYAARPEITTFTMAGQAAEADSVDPGVEEVWQIACSGTTSSGAAASVETFFLQPSGTTNNYTPEVFTITPSGNAVGSGDYTFPGNPSYRGQGSPDPAQFDMESAFATRIIGTNLNVTSWVNDSGNSGLGFGVAFTYFGSLTEMNAVLTTLGLTNITSGANSYTEYASPTLKPAISVSNADVTISIPSTSYDGITVQWVNSSSYGAIRFVNTSSTALPISVVGDLAHGDTFTTESLVGAAAGTSVALNLSGTTTTFTFTAAASGAAAVGAALNTLIGTTYDALFTKTFASATGVITLTAKDGIDRTLTATKGGGGTATFTIGNTALSGSASTLQIVITTESIDQTLSLGDNLTGTALINDIVDKLNNNTAITAQFSVSTATHNSNPVITLTANDITNHSLSATVAQNGGTVAVTTGSIVEGSGSTNATTILIDWDADITATQQSITFSAHSTAAAIAGELAEEIDDIDGLTATRASGYTTTTEVVRDLSVNSFLEDLDYSNVIAGFYTATITIGSSGDTYAVTSGTIGGNTISIQLASTSVASIAVNDTLYFIQSTASETASSLKYYQYTVTAFNNSTKTISLSRVTTNNNEPSTYVAPSDEGSQEYWILKTLPSFGGQIKSYFQGQFHTSATENFGTNATPAATRIYHDQAVVGDVFVYYSDFRNSTFFSVNLFTVTAVSSNVCTVTRQSGGGNRFVRGAGTMAALIPALQASAITGTTFTSSASASNVLIKPTTLKGDQAQPTITVLNQGTGTAAFTVSTQLPGRTSIPGSAAFSAYTVSVAGSQVANGVLPSAGSSSEVASRLQSVINGLSTHSATVSGSVVTATTSSNSGDDITVGIVAGTNETGKSSTNNITSTRALSRIGSSSDVYAGQDATIVINIGTQQHGDTVTRAGGTITQLTTAVDTAVDTADADITQRYTATVPSTGKVRCTASNFVGPTPTITMTVSPGSTATDDAIGNITITNATLAVTRTVVNDGEMIAVVSGDKASYSVTQGNETLITTTDFVNGVTATAAATALTTAINAATGVRYGLTSSGGTITATSVFEDSSPDLTITVSPGSTGNPAVANNLAVTKTVTTAGAAGSVNLSNAQWTVYPIDLTTGNVIGRQEFSAGSTNFTDTTLQASQTYTSTGDKATLVLSGAVCLPSVTTTTASRSARFKLQYSINHTDSTPTWTDLYQSPAFPVVTTSALSGDLITPTLPIAATLDITAANTYAFRVTRTGSTPGSGGIHYAMLLEEKVRR